MSDLVALGYAMRMDLADQLSNPFALARMLQHPAEPVVLEGASPIRVVRRGTDPASRVFVGPGYRLDLHAEARSVVSPPAPVAEEAGREAVLVRG